MYSNIYRIILSLIILFNVASCELWPLSIDRKDISSTVAVEKDNSGSLTIEPVFLSPRSDTGWPLIYVDPKRLKSIEFNSIESKENDVERVISYSAVINLVDPIGHHKIDIEIVWDDHVFYPYYHQLRLYRRSKIEETNDPPEEYVGIGVNPRAYPSFYEDPILLDVPGGGLIEQPSLFARADEKTGYTRYMNAHFETINATRYIRWVRFMGADKVKYTLHFTSWHRFLEEFLVESFIVTLDAKE